MARVPIGISVIGEGRVVDLPFPESIETVSLRRTICFFDRGSEAMAVWRMGNWESKAGENGESG